MGVFSDQGLRGADMRTLSRQRRLTRWSLIVERAARAFWPFFVVVCIALTLALLGGFTALGPFGHRVLLAILGMGVAISLVLAGMRFRMPTMADIDSRLDDGDPRRPLATLADSLAVGHGDLRSETVWQAHLKRARAAAAGLRARMPDLRLARFDTWALRLAAPAVLIGALIATNGDLTARIAAVAKPAPIDGSTQSAAFKRAATAEAWAVPPAYTGLSTVYLERSTAAVAVDGETAAPTPLRLPEGSELTIRVSDADLLPELSGGALAGIEGFTQQGGGLAEAIGLITESGELVVTLGDRELARWLIEVIPDAPPSVELLSDPFPTVTRALQLEFQATDDYGVSAAWAEIAPEGHDPEQARGLPLPAINFGLPMPLNGDLRDVSDTAIRDFSSHPWAGAELDLTLKAEDGAGQVASAPAHRFVLPARIFHNPMAKALVEQRRALALDYDAAYRVLDVLQAVTRRPEDIFDDPGVYLPVRIAIRRLAGSIGTETVPDVAPDVIEFLWQAALALEDGDLSSSLERLRQAQEALREALENGTEEDIRRAMEEMRAAMNDYLQQLAQQAQRNPNAQAQQQQMQNQQMTQQDLNEMLDRMMEQAENGLRDQAQQMLSEMQRMLENMQAAQGQQQQQGPGQQAMQELQDMIQRQRDLSDQTFDELRQRRREQQLGEQQGQQGQQGQQSEPGFGEGQGRGDEHGRRGQQGGQMGQNGDPQMGQSGQPGQGGGTLAQQQEALRQQLENLSRGIGSDEAARALEDAARAMGDARDDLSDGANSDAVRDQMEALDRLNEGAQALAEQMQQGQGDTQAQGDRQGRGRAQDQTDPDPFDRPSASFGALDGTSTKVPDQSLMDRARELMEELRRRAAEPARPQIELDYLDRLMDRF
ncbi:MAG: TIGR02302 family protein [Pseudomonadota bacterium]